MKTPSPNVQYATKLAIPVRLTSAAKENAALISQVVLDAYKFIHSRCNKDLQLGVIVALSLSALFQEYETGEFTKVEDLDQEAIARENAEVLGGITRKRMLRVEEIAKEVGRKPIKELAEKIYNEQRALNPTNPDGIPYPDFWDSKVEDKTRSQYLWVAAVALHRGAA